MKTAVVVCPGCDRRDVVEMNEDGSLTPSDILCNGRSFCTAWSPYESRCASDQEDASLPREVGLPPELQYPDLRAWEQ